MTGPEHYVEAERLAAKAAEYYEYNLAERTEYAVLAQVHATLALADATSAVYYGSPSTFGSQTSSRVSS